MLLLGCDPGAGVDEPTLERIRREGVVRVGFANEAPFAFIDTSSGRLTGEAPEIARVVFSRLGVGEIEGVLTEFASLIPGLKAGRFDVIAAGMYVTPERCREVAFSQPTYAVGEAFLVAAGNPLQLHGYEDVRDRADVRLGVMAGAVERDYAERMGIPEARVVVFPDAPSAVAGLLAGRIDAFAATSLTAGDLLAKATGAALERAEPFRNPVFEGRPARGHGAFASRKSNPALREAVDGELKAFLGSPEHRALVRPFGFTERELPGERSTAELCRAGG
jgi:polar amino acid transport system substrate-binding protein